MSNNSSFRYRFQATLAHQSTLLPLGMCPKKLKASQEEHVSTEVVRNVTGWHRYFGLQYPVSGGNLALPSFYLALPS
jgi:hypothetical protein